MSQIKVDSIVPSGGLPSGSSGGIVQIKSVTKTDTFRPRQLVTRTYRFDAINHTAEYFK